MKTPDEHKIALTKIFDCLTKLGLCNKGLHAYYDSQIDRYDFYGQISSKTGPIALADYFALSNLISEETGLHVWFYAHYDRR